MDIINLSRYQHLSDKQFHEILLANTLLKRQQIAIKYGLCLKPPVLSQLLWDRYLQFPQDIYHTTAGKII